MGKIFRFEKLALSNFFLNFEKTDETVSMTHVMSEALGTSA